MAYRPTNPGWGAAATWAKKKKKKQQPTGGRTAPASRGQTPEEWAQEQAQRYIDAQVSAIEAQRQAYLDELQRQSTLVAQRGQALGEYLRKLNMGATIQGIFSNAGNDIAGFAQGFAGNVRDIASREAAEQQRMLSGTGQEGAVRNEGVDMGDVIYGYGGQIPGTALVTSGAAYGADAAMQPAFATRIGALEAERLLNTGLTGPELRQFALEIAQAKAQAPQLENEFLTQRQSLVQDQREWEYKLKRDRDKDAIDQLERERDYWFRMQAYYNQIGDDARAASALALRQDAEARLQAKQNAQILESQGLAPDGVTPLPGYYRDAAGRITPKGFRWKRNPKTGVDELVPIKDKPKTNRKGESVDWNRVSKNVGSDIKDLLEDRNFRGRTRKAIANYLFAKYGGASLKTAAQRAKLRKIIIAALLAANWPIGGNPTGEGSSGGSGSGSGDTTSGNSNLPIPNT